MRAEDYLCNGCKYLDMVNAFCKHTDSPYPMGDRFNKPKCRLFVSAAKVEDCDSCQCDDRGECEPGKSSCGGGCGCSLEITDEGNWVFSQEPGVTEGGDTPLVRIGLEVDGVDHSFECLEDEIQDRLDQIMAWLERGCVSSITVINTTEDVTFDDFYKDLKEALVNLTDEYDISLSDLMNTIDGDQLEDVFLNSEADDEGEDDIDG